MGSSNRSLDSGSIVMRGDSVSYVTRCHCVAAIKLHVVRLIGARAFPRHQHLSTMDTDKMAIDSPTSPPAAIPLKSSAGTPTPSGTPVLPQLLDQAAHLPKPDPS